MGLLVGGLLALSACTTSGTQGPSSPSAGPHRGGNLVFAQLSEPTSLQKTAIFDNEAIWDSEMIFETLFVSSKDGKSTQPWLATSYESSADHMTWTFHLRPGVSFSNGKPMTAADVKFSIDQARVDQGGWAFIDAAIKDVQSSGSDTVIIHTKSPWAPLLADLALFSNSIIPANYGGASKAQFYKTPIGTGPFVFDKWVHGQYLRLVRNPHYWQKVKPYLDSVTFTDVPEDNTRIVQVKGGAAQIDEFPPFSVIDSLQKGQGVNLDIFSSSRTDLLYLNTLRAPFQDQNARLAVAYAIDRAALVKAVLFGHGQPANSFIAPSLAYYDSSLQGARYDLAKAKQFLAQSSVPQGFNTTLLIGAGLITQTTAQIIQQDLKALNINVSIESRDPNTAFTYLQTHRYDMTLNYWTTDIPDPEELIGGYVDTNGQWTSLVNPNTRRWNAQADQSFDSTQRQTLYANIQTQVDRDGSVISLYYSPFVYLTSDKVHGFSVVPTGNLHLENVWVSS